MATIRTSPGGGGVVAAGRRCRSRGRPRAAGSACTRTACRPLDLEHLLALEAGQPRVREVERNRDPGHAIGREPFVREPEVRPELNAARGELLVEIGDPLLQRAAFDRQIQLRHPQVEELVVRPFGPERWRPAARRWRLGTGRRRWRRGRRIRGCFGRVGRVGGGLDHVHRIA